MKLAAWKYLSVIMALVLVLGTGVTALVPAVPATAAAPAHHSSHATDNTTGRHDRGPSENHTHHFPGLSQSSPAGMYTAGAGSGWYVNGALGTNDGSHGTGTGVAAFKTIQYALNAASSGDTINIAAAYESGDFYNEKLTISKSISLVGEVVDGDRTSVEQSGELIFDITAPGLDVSISNMRIMSYNWVGQCIRASGDTLTLDNVDFFGDRRNGGGGGGIYADNCTLTLTGCYIDGDAGNDNGGAIYADNCTLTLNGCIGWGNAYLGGVIYALDSTVSATDCYFIEGIASGGGGAIYVNSSNLTALRCSFNGDWEGMAGDGQGVYINAVDDNCTVDISNCTFSENYLDGNGSGGGIYVTSENEYSANVTLTCCTFYNNEVEGYGGGLYQVGDNSTTTIRNCIFDNDADEEGDNIYLESGTVSSDYNLYSDTPDITLGANDITDEDSLCYGMADNGGLTPTCAIDSTSPARGAGGTILATDQRGVTRVAPKDIGAYQWVGPTYANDLTGSDANSGLSAAAPKKHIYAAVNLAGPGSTTHVAAGTYDEENHWDVYELDYYNIGITKPLTLIGAGAASTVIDGGHPVYENYGPIIDVYDVDWVFDDATVSISGLTLKNATDEEEDNDGGGLAIWDGNANVQNCVIDNNYAYYGGGGIYIEAGEVALIGCTITNNSACYDGGGIDCGADNLTISGCTISGNESTDGYGGGIYLDDCYIFSLVDSTVSGNSASEDGGGIYGEDMYGYDEAESYDTLISRCTIDDNTADGDGGGIYLYSVDDSDYPVRMEACTLSNNEAGGDGGGLYNYYDSAVDLTNCTIYGNSLTNGGSGGGIYNSGHAELLNCTIAENDAGTGGEGGGWYEEGTITGIFTNTILANNTADGSDNDIAGQGSVDSLGHNICTTDAAKEYFTCATDNVSTDPHLGSLQANGGPTWTCAIGATSPAFDTAEDGPATDQRGVLRPQYVYKDVGAYELSEAAAPTISSITPSTGVNTGPVSITNLAGTNFADNATVKLTRIDEADISGTSVAFVSSSKLTCTFDLTGAATGTWNVVVTNPDAQSGTLTNGFTVTAPAMVPSITTIAPNNGNQGQCPMTVIITGTNLTGAIAVSFGTGITVSGKTVNSSGTQLTATICIDASATPGAHNVSVTTPGGTGTKTGGFTVVQQNQSIGTGAPTSHGSSMSGPTSPAPPVSLPNMVIQSAAISAKTVTPGTPITVTADIANKSTVNGSKKVTLYVNGQVETTQGITVNSGGSTQLTFNVSRSEPGDYTVYVDGVPAGSFKVELFRESDGILIFSVIMLAGAFVVGLIMLRRRQNSY